jgi:hypothetical protein
MTTKSTLTSTLGEEPLNTDQLLKVVTPVSLVIAIISIVIMILVLCVKRRAVCFSTGAEGKSGRVRVVDAVSPTTQVTGSMEQLCTNTVYRTAPSPENCELLDVAGNSGNG